MRRPLSLPPKREANVAVTEQPDESNHLSVKDMQDWLSQELRDLDKARELRIKEATGFVEAYARGELTSREASERLTLYEDRWGEALPGAICYAPHDR